MTPPNCTGLLLPMLMALQTSPLSVNAGDGPAPELAVKPATNAVAQEHSPATLAPGWNDPKDMAMVSRAFRTWTDAVIAKDRATIESFHDEGFRAGLGNRVLTKAQHIQLELIVENKEMKLTSIEATRRVGDILLVWSTHFIRVDALPEIPSLGLFGDWGDEKAAKRGFSQNEFSVWRFADGRIKCLEFATTRAKPAG
jgi:hypothetical protein